MKIRAPKLVLKKKKRIWYTSAKKRKGKKQNKAKPSFLTFPVAILQFTERMGQRPGNRNI